MTETTLQRNVNARKAANTVVELGITAANDEGFEPDQVRRMWQYVVAIASKLAEERVVKPKPKPLSIAQEWSAVGADSMDDEGFPFGKHEGERFEDIPDSYFQWLARQDWIDKWPHVLDYLQENGFD